MNASAEKSPAAALYGRRVAGTVLLLVAGFALFGKYLPFAGALQLAGSGLRQLLGDFAPYWPYALIAIALYLLFTKPRPKS
jgi:di/tricarboxylate transporter